MRQPPPQTKKHGQYKTPEYAVWIAMRGRCKNEKNKHYPNYGGRGITVSQRWNSFENFIADMGKRPPGRLSLDRINNDLGYFPENCRWATRIDQNNNTRSNLLVEYQGREMTFAQAYRLSNSPTDMTNAFKRYKRGWPLCEALHSPPAKSVKKLRTFSRQVRRAA